MYFKLGQPISSPLQILLKRIFTLILLSSMMGCSWLRDPPKEPATLQNDSLDLSCLNEVPTQLEKLFAGKITPKEQDQRQARAIWNCLDRSLESFSKYTQGTQLGVYNSKELATFANRYLPKNKPLTPAFTRAIFRLKRAVLGGTDQLLTQEEIQGLRRKLLEFGSMIVPLAQHMSVLVDIQSRNRTPARLQAAAALQTFILKFADLLSDSKNPLDWADLIGFVSELELYTRVGDPTPLTYVKEQGPLYQYLKYLLVGGDEFAIETTKWRPIFEAISHFYSALFLATNTVESLDELSIEVSSSDAEQQRAVQKINQLLITLKGNQKLSSRRMIRQMADRWGKLLVLNGLLFPKTQGSLALKPFLGTPALRKLAGTLIDLLMKLDQTRVRPSLLESLASGFTDFLNQAAMQMSGTTRSPDLNLSAWQQSVVQLAPLFESPSDHQAILIGIDLAKIALPVFAGREASSFSSDDLRSALQKTVALYQIWDEDKKTSLAERTVQSLNVLTRSPTFSSIRRDSLLSALQLVERLNHVAKLRLQLKSPQLRSWIAEGFSIKAQLFASDPQSISITEVNRLADLGRAFNQHESISDGLVALADHLKKNPLANLHLPRFFSSLSRLLSSGAPAQRNLIDAEILGLFKSALVGGSATTLSSKEYSDLLTLASHLTRRLNPFLDTLQSDPPFGLNSFTVELANAFLQGWADSRISVPYSRLHPLILQLAKQQKFNLRASTLNKFLIGFHHRMLNRNPGPKPTRVVGSFGPDQIKIVLGLTQSIQADWKELETVYQLAGARNDSLSRAALLQRLKRPELIHIVKVIPPILTGKDLLPFFSGHGARPNFDQSDLVYKSMMRRVVQWIFPGYQIEADPLKHTGRLTYHDLVDLLVDINDVILDLGLTYGVTPPPVTATKRMQTINLFTKNGNGDDHLDFDETTEFLTISAGGKTLLDRTLSQLLTQCSVPSAQIQRKFIPYSCLTQSYSRPQYFNQTYRDVVPEMVRQYSNYSEPDRQEFMRSMFNATDPQWETKTELHFSDFEVFLAIPYYAESIFERLDANHDQVVNFTEALNEFGLFCREIRKAAGSSVKGSCEPGEDPRQLEAVFGHLLFFGEPPRGIRPGDSWVTKAREIKNFLLWVRRWNRLPRDSAIRNSQPPQLTRKEVLQIISNLAMAVETPAPSPVPPTR